MKRMTLSVCVVVAVLGNLAAAQDGAGKSPRSKGPMKLTSEQRQKMAGLHDGMAKCLRSESPISECRQEMMKGCNEAMGKDGCPMMDGKMGHGAHQHMMDEPGEAKE